MRQKSGKLKEPAEKVVKNIRRATRKRHSAEEKKIKRQTIEHRRLQHRKSAA